jgi:adenosylcobinamide-GDP ribazoletransferase
VNGVRLALTTLTVLPLRPGPVDRRAAAVAMSLAPAVGVALGAVAGGIGFALHLAQAPALLCGVAVVATMAALTRGLHLDGLADTADGLGAYGDRALAVMKSPDVGAFGVVSVVLALLAGSAAAAALADTPAAIAIAAAASRLAVTWACRRGVPAARRDGLGALVAGTVPPWALALGTAAVVVGAVVAVPGRAWQGPVAVVVGLALSVGLVKHTLRRFGGITGDVLGAAVEVTFVATLVGLTLGGT